MHCFSAIGQAARSGAIFRAPFGKISSDAGLSNGRLGAQRIPAPSGAYRGRAGLEIRQRRRARESPYSSRRREAGWTPASGPSLRSLDSEGDTRELIDCGAGVSDARSAELLFGQAGVQYRLSSTCTEENPASSMTVMRWIFCGSRSGILYQITELPSP